jgi:hypothetical protein
MICDGSYGTLAPLRGDKEGTIGRIEGEMNLVIVHRPEYVVEHSGRHDKLFDGRDITLERVYGNTRGGDT